MLYGLLIDLLSRKSEHLWACLEYFGTGLGYNGHVWSTLGQVWGAMKIIRTKIKTKNDNLRL